METISPQSYPSFPRMHEGKCRVKGCNCNRFEGMTDLPDERCSNCFHSIEAHTLPVELFNNIKCDKPTILTTPREVYRKKIAMELLTTERTYVRMLMTCLRCYADPLQSCEPPLLPPTLYKSIFLFYRDIVRVNLVFLQSLEDLVEKNQLVSGLSSVFLGTLPYLRVYRMFVGNNSVGLQAVEQAEHMKDVVKLLHHCSKYGYEGETVQPLRSYLILPIQRIPRYNLLLSDFLKHTDRNDPLFEETTALVGSLKSLAKEINDEVKLQDNRRKLLAIKKKFCEGPYHLTLVEAHRYIMREGILFKLSKTKPKKRYFYLFNDILVYGRMQLQLFYPNLYLRLNSVHIEDGLQPNTFNLLSPFKSFTVICSSIEERNTWANDLKSAIQKESDKKFSKNIDTVGFDAPLYQPFNEATLCFICKRKFGIFCFKYHCERCGFVVCDSCSKNRKIVPPNPVPQRICNFCVRSADRNIEVFKGLRKRSKQERARLALALLE
ncbi:rho guanine nucleotide exchange factor putative [Entamoeba histolytica]|uniref:Rho guanine nucleotide exchange factor, putative n=6 Tax=Entamoeba histolytica TaxID=5759 RepID=C4M5V1_ENTH1|nr:Rho guanine nucleotide exchange factor, putative [Entamoeba histolytica HM-1:IMSS]EAL49997.1 Rho guanine nucleotide exchange factor, putative [Entamoeba histolytica HM-1:IMSS]EMD46745.1 rho/RAC guanine nucleotide exchange factor, putative [Entamoeba histolytica KU27]ENY64925.1 Rho/RAC guanine nucleotide exchange factor, putative [Entamoeba histolytica HM-1:IMSS-A]GAT96824.1 rho guanine nucleotide exchange factor putative [Entamoeba histolytica]|eukprot:XP_655384.1 Rho guanine nucleotide exchange factor, putative [Entamoeba histolytica HM-1:IMSS]